MIGPYAHGSHSGNVLRAALEARSYKKELVLVANSLHKPGGLVQFVSNMEALGYAHILLLSYDRKECQGLLKLLPSMGCVWASFSFEKDSGIEDLFLLWFLRWGTYRYGATLLLFSSPPRPI